MVARIDRLLELGGEVPPSSKNLFFKKEQQDSAASRVPPTIASSPTHMKIIENYFDLDSVFEASAFPNYPTFSEPQHRLYSFCDDPKSILKGCTSVVAIPAQNEELYIGDCLTALARQSGDRRYGVLLLLNNCPDRRSHVIPNLF